MSYLLRTFHAYLLSPPHPLPPSLWSQVSIQHLLPHVYSITLVTPSPPSPCSQVSHPLMMVGRTVTKSRLVNGGRSAVPMVLNFGGSESSSQGLLLTHLTTCTLAHLHHTHNCTIVPHTHTHSVMAPPIHLGAWSMALMLWLSFELLPHTHNIAYTCIHTVVPNAHNMYVRTHSNTLIRRYTYTHTHFTLPTQPLILTPTHTHTHPPSLTRIRRSQDCGEARMSTTNGSTQ